MDARQTLALANLYGIRKVVGVPGTGILASSDFALWFLGPTWVKGTLASNQEKTVPLGLGDFLLQEWEEAGCPYPKASI